MGLFVHGGAASDWHTFTTFDREAYDRLRDRLIVDGFHGARQATLMQYQGARGDGWFCGTAEQAGRWHGLVQCEGGVSHRYLPIMLSALPEGALRDGRVRCSRVDVQITVPLYDGVDLRLWCDGLRNPATSWQRPGRRPRVDLFDNDDGLSTLYIGSYKTQNGVFVRLYVKEEEGQRWLRYELVARGYRAQAIISAHAEGVPLASMLKGEMDTLPLRLQERLSPLYEALPGESLRVLHVVEPSDDSRRLAWFDRQVRDALASIEDYTISEMVEYRLERLASDLRKARDKRLRAELDAPTSSNARVVEQKRMELRALTGEGS